MILKPPAIRLDSDALQAWIDYHDAVERELGQYGEFTDIDDIASKSAENAARIAGVFAIFDQGKVPHTLAKTYMDAGIAVAGWHLNEARRIFLDADTPEKDLDARELSCWLSGRGRELTDDRGQPIINEDGIVSVREIGRRGPNRVRDAERRDDALKILEEAGHVRRADRGKQRRIAVNPKLVDSRQARRTP